MEIRWKTESGPRPVIREKNGVVWLSFPLLEQTGMVVQGFTTRLGGVSRGIFSSMNLSFTRGDEEEAVRENFRRAGAAMGFSVESIVTSDQTHTNHVRRVSGKDCGSGILRPRNYSQIDGLLTDEPGVTLATFYADCVPLFFVDPVHHAIALSHSGWRGTVQRIGRVTVEKMKQEFGSRPEDLVTAIGPSICQDCYEVGEDVAEAFYEEFGRDADRTLLYEKGGGKYLLNLWEANRRVLTEAGVPGEKIQMPCICTCCNPEFLFSHRASHGKRGNLGAFLMLKRP
ncbi:MAG TPA: peptidoglycan editing factor PgeF [Candidatus Scatomonas pullistercoris]|uniref:Purine nucleoside phosphorylase n=1 Tax=Candidatus Scatomonas pullistercoris TaxID=2840920 RepID=A0A9D1P2Z2_9FIRM|nr:peptidoglycan editing factor PgeF [Candidatus Scatomonas pullistercoris]